LYLTTPDKVTLAAIDSGRPGIVETLHHMRRIAREARRDFFIRRKAEQIIAHIPGKDWVGEARAIHAFVRDEIIYRLDPNETEMIRTPAKVLEAGIGDCDDKATLAAALLEAAGHPARFVAVGFAPGELTHVYVETRIGDRWFAVETTELVDFGWSVPGVMDRETVSV
jgi:transglutaminase-like putative cysteine protease